MKHQILFVAALFPACAGSAAEQPVRSLRVELPGQSENVVHTSWPGIGCWFWGTQEFQPDGFKHFVDTYAQRTAFALLTTSIRHRAEVTQTAVHDQILKAARYARDHGMEMVMDLDVRLARQAFYSAHPGEMQEIVRLREVPFPAAGEAQLVIESMTLCDHYTPMHLGVRPYESIAARLVRAYSYVTGPGGIDPDSVRDITDRCRVEQADGQGFQATIPATAEDRGRTACLMAAFTLFSPDVFAPHLIEFERNILGQYADVPLAGACKDEWGFPGRFQPRLDDIWFSRAMAEEYARRRPGHSLVDDLFLMVLPQSGRESERLAAVNCFMEMNWQRNAAVENAYYDAIKEVFGPQAMSATHPTWYPDPATTNEVFKNGLHWWACKRDLAQTDESTPFCVRTALAKKWHSPLWVNMYYERSLDRYKLELWRSVLGGGRLNYHPVYPAPADVPPDFRTTSLLDPDLQIADCRVRLLNYISSAPVHCPAAIVFGHPAALNWAGSGLADVGLSVADALWAAGFYTDLIPSSEIAAGNLKIGADGSLQYGPQRYAVAVFYQPQYERPEVGDFFTQVAAAGKTELLRVGAWTIDFDGRPVNDSVLPPQMRMVDESSAAGEALAALQAAGEVPQTKGRAYNAMLSQIVMPDVRGSCRLLDGTVILASGEERVTGDPIQQTVTISGPDAPVEAHFDAVGVAAVRLDAEGKVAALAAGGLKSFCCGDMRIDLPHRIDTALWRDLQGRWQGVVQGHSGPIPEALTRITPRWTRLSLPAVAGN